MKEWISRCTANERNAWCLAGVIVALHFSALFYYFVPVSMGPDSAGYHVQTRQIAEYGRTWFDRESPMQYIPPHWLAFGEDRFVSRYPAGLPALLAPVYWIGGTYAVALMNPIFTSLALVFLFLTIREWVGTWWALTAMLMMAFNQVANTWTYMGDAHPATAGFLLMGMYLLILWSKNHSVWLALASGFILGMIPTLRYPEAIYSVGIGLFLFWHWRKIPRLWPSVLAAIVGALIPTTVLLLYNKLALGVFWRSTYELGFPIFSIEYFLEKFFPYLGLLIVRGIGVFFLLGFAGIIWMLIRRESRPQGLLLTGIVFPITLAYMSYFFFDISLRFLLPTLYLYSIAAVWLLSRWHGRWPKSVTIGTAALLVIAVAANVPQTSLQLEQVRSSNMQLYTMEQVVRHQVEPSSIVIAPEPVDKHLDFIGQWQLADSRYFGDRYNRRMQPPGMEDRRERKPGERNLQRMIPMGDHSKIEERYGSDSSGTLSEVLLNDLKDWAGADKEIYWLGSADRIAKLSRLNSEITYQLLKTFKAPEKSEMRLPSPPFRRNQKPGFHRPRRGDQGPGPGRSPGPPGGFRMDEDYVLALVKVQE